MESGVNAHAERASERAREPGAEGLARPMDARRQQGLVATWVLCQAQLAASGESADG